MGQDVTALLKSYMDGIPLVLPDHARPTPDLKFDNRIKIEELETVSQSEAWSMLKFLCSMRGLVINPDNLEYVRIGTSSLTFRGVEIQFKKCHVFPHARIKTDLEIIETRGENSYKILDFMMLFFRNLLLVDLNYLTNYFTSNP